MTIKKRFYLLIGITLIAMLAVLGLGILGTESTKALEEEHLQLAGIKADMLTLRRNEKDFLARKDLKYVDKFEHNHAAALALLDDLNRRMTASGLDTAGVQQLRNVLVRYGQDFQQLVAIQKQIGLHPKDGLYGSLREAVHGVEKRVKAQGDYHLLSDMLMLRRNEKDFMLRDNLKYVGKFDNNITKFEATLAASDMPGDAKAAIAAKLAKYRDDFHALVSGYKRKGLTPSEGVLGEMRNTIHQSETLIGELGERAATAVAAEVKGAKLSLLIVGSLLTGLLAGLLLWIARAINNPIRAFEQTMRQAADGRDLTLRAADAGKGEISDMARAYNTMMDEFQGVLGQVVSSANQVGNAAGELSVVTEKTADGVQRQKAESDQVATAMNEMAATVQEVAGHAADAANASRVADEEAARGKQVVGRATDGIRQLVGEVENTAGVIQQLEQESANIGTVLSVITGIAEQTNLLALNAAIEAARAGEQGRGFAVVADEVRTLAQRSQQSTEEIKSIIERLQSQAKDAVKAMEAGRTQAQVTVEQAEAAASSLSAITSAVAAISDMNTQIASAAEEQSAVAEEINRSVVNIAEVAEETASGSLQTRHTTSDLAGLASELQQRVGIFRLGEAGGALDLSKAKAAHAAWKARLRDFLDGRGALSASEATSHKDCSLGKWYYGEGLSHFGHLPEMQALEAPHAELHRLIRQIIEAKQAGDMLQAEALFKQVAPLSEEIVALLGTIERQAS